MSIQKRKAIPAGWRTRREFHFHFSKQTGMMGNAKCKVTNAKCKMSGKPCIYINADIQSPVGTGSGMAGLLPFSRIANPSTIIQTSSTKATRPMIRQAVLPSL